MTNLQLLLTIGIPSFLVVLSWISNNTRLALQDKRFDDLEQRLDKRFGDLEQRLDRRFSDVDKRFGDLEQRLDRRFSEIDTRFGEIDRRFGEIDRRLDEAIRSQHRDALEILRNMTALHERVALVESRQAS